MNIKQYRNYRIVITILLAIVISQSIILQNYIIPLLALALAMAILFYLRSRLKGEVLVDERDYALAGKAATWSIQIFSLVAVVIMLVLYANRNINPLYLAIATTLAYAVCFLMIMYSVIFKYLSREVVGNKKKIILILIVLLVLILTVVGLRLLSGEDDWICQNGVWIKHGQPDFPAPSIECKK